MSKKKSKKKRDPSKKRRDTWVSGTTSVETDRLQYTYDHSTEKFSFDPPLINIYIEVSHKRADKPKNPKVLSRTPSLSDSHGFDPDQELESFDHIFAVDTGAKGHRRTQRVRSRRHFSAKGHTRRLSWKR
jgi:hypothetical protein